MKNILFNFLGRRFFKRIYQYAQLKQKRAYQVQQRLWRKRLKALKGTQIYSDLNLAKIRSYDDYIKKIGVLDYEFYRPYIEKVAEGEQNILFRDSLDCMALTSGTSGFNNKFIPMNSKMVKLFYRFNLSIGAEMSVSPSNLNLVSDKRLTFAPDAIMYEKNNIKYGYITGIVAGKKAKLNDQRIYPPREVFAIEDWDEQVKAVLNTSAAQDIKIVQGIPGYICNLFRTILEQTGKNTISELWPNLDTFVFLSTPVDHLKETIRVLVGKDLNFFGIYAATEAPIGFRAIHGNIEKYQLNLNSVLFSFSPLHDTTKSLGVHEVQTGQKYYLNTGTPNGILQYPLGDIIQVTQVNPRLEIQIVGRKGGAINIAGEKVSQASLLKTIHCVQKELNIPIDHFFVYPHIPKKGRPFYQWTLCLPEGAEIDREKISFLLDETLMKVDLDYEEKRRTDDILSRCQVNFISSQWSKNYFQRFRKKGQLKMKMIFENQVVFEQFWQDTFQQKLKIMN